MSSTVIETTLNIGSESRNVNELIKHWAKVINSPCTSVVMGTLLPTREPANLLPAGIRVPVNWNSVTRTHLECYYPGVPGYPFTTLLCTLVNWNWYDYSQMTMKFHDSNLNHFSRMSTICDSILQWCRSVSALMECIVSSLCNTI